MHVKIQASAKADGNTGSCRSLAEYLEKENKGKEVQEREFFFSQDRDIVSKRIVVSSIDNNKKGLGKNDAKFYCITISPSAKELGHLMSRAGGDPQGFRQQLMDYTRSTMDEYAKNFNRGLEGKDLMYFAKIEYEREYKGTDNIPEGFKQGNKKPGNQAHIHVIVSRKDNEMKKKLSPLANEKASKSEKSKLNGKDVVRGFNRNAFYEKLESSFDQQFEYKREREETIEHHKIMKLGTPEDQAAEKEKTLNIGADQEQEIKQKVQEENKVQKRSRGRGMSM